MHSNIAKEMGFSEIPSKSTIARAYSLIPDDYLVQIHKLCIKSIERYNKAGDATGYSNNRSRVWCDVRSSKDVKTRKDWNKLHVIIDIAVIEHSSDRQ